MPYTLIKPETRIIKTAQNPFFFSRRENEKRKRAETTGLNWTDKRVAKSNRTVKKNMNFFFTKLNLSGRVKTEKKNRV